MIRLRSRGLATLALLTFATLTPAAAQDFFDTDGETITTVSGDAYIGSLRTTAFTVFADSGTSVEGTGYTFNRSTLSMSDGTFTALWSGDNSTANISGGSVEEFYDVHNDAVVNMSGGQVGFRLANGGVTLYERSRLNLSGGDINKLDLLGSAQLSTTGGQFFEAVDLYENSRGTFGGGTAYFTVAFRDTSGASSANLISGGDFRDTVDVTDAARLAIRGGSFASSVNATLGGLLDIRGGAFVRSATQAGLNAQDDAVITLYGTNLAITNTEDVGGFTELTLAGILEDGTSINGLRALTSGNGQVRLVAVPGPAALPLFAIGLSAFGLRARRVRCPR